MFKIRCFKPPFCNTWCFRVCLFLALCLGTSCEEVIVVDLSTAEPRLVIDAFIGVNENNGALITSGQVRLTLTAPFFQEQVPPVTGATVEIIDEETGQVFPLTEDEPGIFRTGLPDLQFDRDYTLNVTHNGEVYTATERLNRAPVIDKLEQGDGFVTNPDEETEVKITFTDIPGERNQYLFSFGFEEYLVVEDEFFQDQAFTFSYFYEDIGPGTLLTIILFGIDEDFATYTDLILTQTENNNGPFSAPPATVRGNIINTTHFDNFPFGYFALSEFSAQQLTIE